MPGLSGQIEVVDGTPGRFTEHLDPGRITESLGVVNLAGFDRDAVANMEHETHAGAGHEQGSAQNPIGFGDFCVEVGWLRSMIAMARSPLSSATISRWSGAILIWAPGYVVWSSD